MPSFRSWAGRKRRRCAPGGAGCILRGTHHACADRGGIPALGCPRRCRAETPLPLPAPGVLARSSTLARSRCATLAPYPTLARTRATHLLLVRRVSVVLLHQRAAVGHVLLPRVRAAPLQHLRGRTPHIERGASGRCAYTESAASAPARPRAPLLRAQCERGSLPTQSFQRTTLTFTSHSKAGRWPGSTGHTHACNTTRTLLTHRRGGVHAPLPAP